VKFWLAFFDQAGNIVDSPILCYAGRMDQPTITEGTETSVISIAVENRLADLQRRIERRFTDRDQRLEYPAESWVGLHRLDERLEWRLGARRPISLGVGDPHILVAHVLASSRGFELESVTARSLWKRCRMLPFTAVFSGTRKAF